MGRHADDDTDKDAEHDKEDNDHDPNSRVRSERCRGRDAPVFVVPHLSGKSQMTGRDRLWRTCAYYGAFIGLGLVLSSLGPTLPALADLAQVSLGALSTVFVARSSGYLAGAMLGGRLFDRFPGHPLMASMLAVMALTMALAPLSPSLTVLTCVFVCLGIAEGTLDVGGNTLLTWLYPTGLGPWMNGLHFFFGVGAMLSPLIVSYAMGFDGSVTFAYWTLAALLIPVILMLLWLPSPPIAAHAREEGLSLRKHRTTIFLVAGLLFATVGAEVGLGNWIFTYALTQQVADESGAALLTSAFWGAFTLGRLLGIPLAARMAPTMILLLCYGGGALAAAVALLQPETVGVVWITTIVSGLAVAPMFATVLSLAGRHMPITGRATGWFFVGSSAGGMTIPWVIGQLFETAGPTSVYVVALVNLAVGLLMYALFVSNHSTRRHRCSRTDDSSS
jgi:MFS transporter, FHS family, Na+ dependent glucose transporter 1